MYKLNIHCLQHVYFEGPEMIELWAKGKGHQLSISKLYQQDALPAISDFDLLIILGGPMGTY